jgi:hypothetical protein
MNKAYYISPSRFGFHLFSVSYDGNEWIKYTSRGIFLDREIVITDYAKESIGTFLWKI